MGIKIGITERGDAGLDFSWVDRLLDVNIIISKNLNDGLINALIENKDKIIFHLTGTGFGGSILEPNVPVTIDTYHGLTKLIKCGFNPRQIVLRIDPIIPTEQGLKAAERVLTLFSLTGIKRVRYSFCDMYNHVKIRFWRAGMDVPYHTFNPPPEMVNEVMRLLNKFKFVYEFEACAENTEHKLGCISRKDFEILGIDAELDQAGYQRPGCLCSSGKTELLENKNRCPHKCLYCYWKDAHERVEKNV